MTDRTGTLGVILAGGGSRRFGMPKDTAILGGIPLLQHVVARARPQVARLALSVGAADVANAQLPVIRDHAPGEGPLAGILAALENAAAEGFAFVATFPCDAPFFPANLIDHLRSGMQDGVDCTMARRGKDCHYVFGLWRTSCLPRLQAAFALGARSMRKLGDTLECCYVDFPLQGDGPDGNAFFNINRPDDLAAAEAWLKQLRASS
ncbi:MAG: molybdenum cofactor guanylyltransferase [Alphaproteobacteria bacterium]|nr:molybdenum cofactor guanylyltransferase [Alphaproteobacteria bacterium]MDE2112110.1 molybdenum cofactor guanylyltransferase [Alphaproteobacteria bacterium]MDE2493908.1 molybdenum cofactor guanylyltransferase [Alphaproteobacteria bacterium]